MFFRKKTQHPEENVAKKGIKHVDKVVTGLILGGIIASIYGVKRSKTDHTDHHEPHHEEKDHHEVTHAPEKVGQR